MTEIFISSIEFEDNEMSDEHHIKWFWFINHFNTSICSSCFQNYKKERKRELIKKNNTLI